MPKLKGTYKVTRDLMPLLRDITTVHEDPDNARGHPEQNIAVIRNSLDRFGQQKPIVVLPDGAIVAGNGTHRAAVVLGWTHIALVTFQGTFEEAEEYGLVDNRSSDLADWNLAVLQGKFTRMDTAQIEQLGWETKEIDWIRSGDFNAPEPMDDGTIPEPPLRPRTRPGNLIELGRHRLLCGDAGSRKDLERLLGGEPVHLLNTDPPYNVKVEPRSNNAIAAGRTKGNVPSGKRAKTHHQQLDLARHPSKAKPTGQMRAEDRTLESDFVSDEEYATLLKAWFGNIAHALAAGRSFYIWGGYSNVRNYPAAVDGAGLFFSQAIIWHKHWPVLTRKDFMGDHEWCFYGWKKGAAHYFSRGNDNIPDVWCAKKVTPQQMVHLTEKPVELAARALTYSSRRWENVLDLFGGSGSTLMAAENMDRKAFLMEIDPAYCDVIVERWKQATGGKPKGWGTSPRKRTKKRR